MIKDLQELSYDDFILSYGKTKTEVILDLIEKPYQNANQVKAELLSYAHLNGNKTYQRILGYSYLQQGSSTLKQCCQVSCVSSLVNTSRLKNVSKMSDVSRISTIATENEILSDLEAERILFEMFGDTDTAEELKKHQEMFLMDEMNKFFYLHADKGACDKCKIIHNAMLLYAFPDAVENKEKYLEGHSVVSPLNMDNLRGLKDLTHPNCRCVLRDYPPNFLHDVDNEFSFSKFLHGLLDVLSMIPLLGNIADGLNAFIYVLEKDYVNAALCGFAAIPGVGIAANGVRYYRLGAKAINNANKGVEVVKNVQNTAVKANDLKNATRHIDIDDKIKNVITNLQKDKTFKTSSTKYNKQIDEIIDTAKIMEKSADNVKALTKQIKELQQTPALDVFKAKQSTTQNIAKSLENASKIETKSTKSFLEQIKDKTKVFDHINNQASHSGLIAGLGDDFGAMVSKAGKKVSTKKPVLQNEPKDAIISKRRTPIQSEQDFISENPEYRYQVSFLNGKEAKYGVKGTSRIDAYKDGMAVEIKNYDLSKKQNRYNLVRTLLRQYEKRLVNLPKGTKQIAEIDIRGQNIDKSVTDEVLDKLQGKYKEVRVKK